MKKFLFLITLLSAMLFATSAFAIDGEGTEESPFLITTQEELLLINDFPDCHFKMMNDIDLEGDWIPLCTSSDIFTGTLDGNGKTISNLTITGNYANIGLFSQNDGTIKNLNVATSETGVSFNYDATSEDYVGIITGKNHDTILNCSVLGNIFYNNESDTYSRKCHIGGIAGYNTNTITKCISIVNFDIVCLGYNSLGHGTYYGDYCYVGGLIGFNKGEISKCVANGILNISKSYYAYIGGISGGFEEGVIYDTYFKGSICSNAYKNNKSYSGGIIGYGNHSENLINNCYAICNEIGNINLYGIGCLPSATVTNSFYDSTVSGLSDTDYGTPKTTLAMTMKKTYSDAGWDFDNVWGISSDINDGNPYLLWEYADDSFANTEIIGATATADSLKFISEVTIEGEPEISSFGTTFIPLWLFESGSTDVATVSYDNSNYNISNAQTFGATLTGIPESCKDMEIVGKSFIKDTDGNYMWSSAKYSSVNDTTLNSLE